MEEEEGQEEEEEEEEDEEQDQGAKKDFPDMYGCTKDFRRTSDKSQETEISWVTWNWKQVSHL